MKEFAHGIYESLLDECLRDALALRPELRAVFGKLDPEEQPGRYASFVAKVLEQALREESDSALRVALCNKILDIVAVEPGRNHLQKHRLVSRQKTVLLEITPPNYGQSGIGRGGRSSLCGRARSRNSAGVNPAPEGWPATG